MGTRQYYEHQGPTDLVVKLQTELLEDEWIPMAIHIGDIGDDEYHEVVFSADEDSIDKMIEALNAIRADLRKVLS